MILLTQLWECLLKAGRCGNMIADNLWVWYVYLFNLSPALYTAKLPNKRIYTMHTAKQTNKLKKKERKKERKKEEKRKEENKGKGHKSIKQQTYINKQAGRISLSQLYEYLKQWIRTLIRSIDDIYM